MRLIPFAHYFELFAGATSALIIVPQINEFITCKLGEKFRKKCDKISKEIDPLVSDANQIIQTLSLSEKEVKNFPEDLKQGIDKKVTKLTTTIEWFRHHRKTLDEETEKSKVNNMAYVLCIFSCLYCIGMLILAGLADDGAIDDRNAFRTIAHFQSLGIPIMLMISLYINREFLKIYSSLLIASFLFTLPIVSCAVSMNCLNNTDHSESFYLFLLITSLVIAIFPFIALFARMFILWPYRLYNFDRKFSEKKAEIQRSKAKLNEVMDFVMKK